MFMRPVSLLSVLVGVCALSLLSVTYANNVIKEPATEQLSLASRIQTGGAAFNTMLGGGKESSSLIADVAEHVAPSVVNIDVEKQTELPNAAMALPFSDEFLRRFFGTRLEGMQRMPQTFNGNGSGVIINTKGYILTNNHVVSNASKLTVTLNDGRKLPGTIVGQDRLTDLAVVKITADKLQPAKLGSSDKLRPGEWVLAVGSPLGFDHTVTVGIISALSRKVPDLNNNVQFIQTDAAINPGNSGGPLVNLQGEVIGINTAISGVAQNIGFAIPVDTVRQVADALVANGKILRPWVGLGLGLLSPNLAESLGLPASTEGVVVSQVAPNSPSARAGIQQGDVIQRVNGQRVTDPKLVQDTVRNKPVNTPLTLQLLRDGQLLGVSLKTELMPEDEPLSKRVIPLQPTQ
jgi:Do/DeqQ family serine protease